MGAETSPGQAGTPTLAGIPGLVMLTTDPSHTHTTSRQTYPQSLPVGGPHWPPSALGVLGWLRCGVYDARVPAEFAVHSEERGAVWLTYRPGTAAADIRALAELVGLDTGYVLVSPFPGQPAAFMASTWGGQLITARPSDPRLVAFVRRYAGGDQGQEGGADCAARDAAGAGRRRAQGREPVAAAPRSQPAAAASGPRTRCGGGAGQHLRVGRRASMLGGQPAPTLSAGVHPSLT